MYMFENALENSASVSGISSLISVAAYVFSALAIYTIAQRRDIKNPWLAWIPMVNVWILGSISDQYRYVAKGEVKNKRKILLGVNILNFILTWVAVIKMIVTIVGVVVGETYLTDEMEAIRQILVSVAFFAPVAILGIVGFVVEIMALYDLYSSCEPANNVLYLVLSLVPGINTVARPLFLFLCRDKDNGMPPRRETVVENPAEF
jgi:hypothetical protein